VGVRERERNQEYVGKFQRRTNFNMKDIDSGTNVIISFSIPSSGMSKHMPRALNDTAIHASNYPTYTQTHTFLSHSLRHTLFFWHALSSEYSFAKAVLSNQSSFAK